VAEDVGGGDGGLVEGDVGEGTLPGDVAHGPDAIAHPEVLVDGQPALRLVHADRRHAQRRQIGAPAGGDEQPGGGDRGAVAQLHRHPGPVPVHCLHRGPNADVDALTGEDLAQERPHLGLVGG
jgi:hypothetical protein